MDIERIIASFAFALAVVFVISGIVIFNIMVFPYALLITIPIFVLTPIVYWWIGRN